MLSEELPYVSAIFPLHRSPSHTHSRLPAEYRGKRYLGQYYFFYADKPSWAKSAEKLRAQDRLFLAACAERLDLANKEFARVTAQN